MKGHEFTYFLREGIKGVFSHGFMSFAAMGVIVSCLIITGSFYMVSLNVNHLISKAESENEVIAFVDETLSETEARVLQPELEQVDNVASTIFVSKDEAFQNYYESLGDESDLLDGLEQDNPLRHRFRVFLTDISEMDKTIKGLSAVKGIAKVSASEEVSEAFIRLRRIVNTISYILTILLVGVSVFITSNTIKLATFDRREEIAIMKMVGATNSFIRWPFIFEGLLLGLIGGFVAFFLQWWIYGFALKRMAEFAQMADLVSFGSVSLPLLLAFLGAGFLVGVGGSVLTIRKFMQV